jgi:hypothetical protein
MANGILGQSNPAANTNTTVYVVPTATFATFNISVVNTGASSAAVNLALAASVPPTSHEFIEFQTILPPGGVLERGGLVAEAAKRVVANCSTSSCSISVYGFEG